MANKGLVKEGSAPAVSGSQLEALIAQQKEIERQIEEVRFRERDSTLQDIRQKIALFEFTPAELGLGGRGRPAKRVRAGVAPKFRDPETGSTWSGRGKPPKWIAGKDRTSFVI